MVIMDLIQAATAMGATLTRACECLGLSLRTIQRWREEGGGDDQRRGPATTPHNKLSEEEEAEVLRVATSADFADLSPNQIVPLLATHGTYIGSESTIYRRLHAAGMMRRRGRARAPSRRPRALTATGPDQLYSWDITYLPTKIRGHFVYLYMIVDIWSRKIIAAEVHERECGAIAADLVERTCAAPARSGKPLWLHSDNGAPMRSATLLTMLRKLGIKASFSRARTSNDNAYSESLFRTLKYRPSYPSRPFNDLDAARSWVVSFVYWYNEKHLHSAISFVTPSDRHAGRHLAILAARKETYAAARAKHPERWTRNTRRWDPIPTVDLNPEPKPESTTRR